MIFHPPPLLLPTRIPSLENQVVIYERIREVLRDPDTKQLSLAKKMLAGGLAGGFGGCFACETMESVEPWRGWGY